MSEMYIKLSLMMFLEFATWAAWMPVLAARLLGPLKMTGKQTGWIYATFPLACIFAPLIAGQVADQAVNAERILFWTHLIGAILLVVAAKMEKFTPLFIVMLLYSCCYTGTLPLVNAVMFANLTNAADSAGIFIWAPIAWALIGYVLTGWRWIFKTEGRGTDCLYMGAVLGFAMAACCLFLPATPPKGGSEQSLTASLAMFHNVDFVVFLVVSMAVAGMMQFYFLGTGRFMQDLGVSAKNVSASMGMAQAVQAVATWAGLGLCFVPDYIGFKWTLIVGAGCWLAMYAIYVVGNPRILILISQGLHGLAYVFFMIVGQIYADKVSPPGIRSSVQAMIFTVTTGVGLFLGTQAAGILMDKFSVDGKFQWPKIWLVPALVTLAGILVMAAAFAGTIPEAPK